MVLLFLIGVVLWTSLRYNTKSDNFYSVFQFRSKTYYINEALTLLYIQNLTEYQKLSIRLHICYISK